MVVQFDTAYPAKMRASKNSLCLSAAVPGLGGCMVAVRLNGTQLEVSYTGTAKDLLSAGLTSIATLKSNCALPTRHCRVIYRVEAFKALSLPGVLQALEASAPDAPGHHHLTGSEADRRELVA
jgi:hypothetical protein